MSDHISLAIADGVARITIDNPEKRNALGLSDLTAMSDALERAADARVLILTGAGDRAFSAGVDLSDVAGDAANWTENPLTALANKLQTFPRPTIARLNGPVIGGSAELSFACDFRIGVDSLKLMVPAVRLGLHYEAEGLARAAAVIGWQAAKRIYLLGETLHAPALDALGYLDCMTTREGLDEAVEDMASGVLASAPLAVDGMKLTMAEMIRNEADEAVIKARIARTWASEDLAEGLSAAAARRKAVFRGR